MSPARAVKQHLALDALCHVLQLAAQIVDVLVGVFHAPVAPVSVKHVMHVVVPLRHVLVLKSFVIRLSNIAHCMNRVLVHIRLVVAPQLPMDGRRAPCRRDAKYH